ncbi:MAG: hypothetical protein A2Y62_12520 [Candidatus Fischerbacteria bacterium RBG_13_37_8]|uniref:Uncharacterized protein n=1 Tax=Candidatus Fischerbacteria bacterium RBG_13_37_8 TaxID=1817863 RepID=A0A1F5VSR0_9BACT|nr:MAG: hypothetical protein A2Y62_12520 [Candidatus Fischerbacteria bacterium RBG_13_37_8]
MALLFLRVLRALRGFIFFPKMQEKNDEETTLFPRLRSEKGALFKSPTGTKAHRHKVKKEK